MLEKRPLIVDENMVVLGGNMRLKALQKAGIKEVIVDIADGWTDEQKKETPVNKHPPRFWAKKLTIFFGQVFDHGFWDPKTQCTGLPGLKSALGFGLFA